MRLISLKLFKIGPYAKEAVIPFDELGNGLVLFTGDTGAGKTMIFDAITYALFGKCSGEHRSEKSLVCSFSPISSPKDRPYVELLFEHDGKQYSLSRSPEYRKEGNKNNSTAEAGLSCEGKTIASKPSDVNTFIKDMLGIDDKQWKQIVMLPQGEFMDLLNADGQKRSELLRKLFNTSRFRALQDTFSKMSKESEEKCIKSKAELDSAIHSLDFSEEYTLDKYDVQTIIDTVRKWCDEEDERLKNSADMKEKLDAAYQDAIKIHNEGMEAQKQRKTLEEKNRVMSVLESEKASMDEKRKLRDKASGSVDLNRCRRDYQSCSNNIAKCEESKNKAESRLESLKSEYETVLQKVNTIPKMESEKEKLNVELNGLRESMDNLREIAKLQPKYDALVKKSDDIEARRIQLSNDFESLTSKRNEINVVMAENSNLMPLLESANSDKLSIEADIAKLNDYVSKVDDLKKQKKSIDDKEKTLKRMHEDYKDSRTKYGDACDLFISSQAGILAKGLSEGQPCPVCGNTHHIKLASVIEGALSKEDLEILKNEVDDKNNKVMASSSELQEQNAIYKSKLDNILEYTKGTFETIDLDLEDRRKELNIKLDEKKTKIAQIEERISVYEANGKELSKIDSEQKKIVGDVQALQKEKESVDLQLKEINEELAVVRSKVTDTDESSLSERMKHTDDRLKDIIKEINDLRQKEKDYNAAESEQHGIISDNATRLNELYPKKSILESEYHKMLEESGMTEEELDKLSEVDIPLLNKEISKFDGDYSSCIASIKQLESSLEGKVDIPIEVLEENVQKAREDFTALMDEISASQGKINTNRSALKRIIEANTIFEADDRRFKALENLSNVANGKMAGTDRIPFEMYAQKTYFDNVLGRANERLGIMSNNRYHLEQSDEGGRSSKNAMDLNVFDSYSGKTREIGSLSGGESFKAALSLALGLSDVVQSTSSGSRVEALFIDEGFGSLDADSLSQAISVLEDLSNGDIPVCIISHIDTLKERVYKKVIVQGGKPGVGSKVSIES